MVPTLGSAPSFADFQSATFTRLVWLGWQAVGDSNPYPVAGFGDLPVPKHPAYSFVID